MGRRMGVVAAILVMTSGSIWGASWREINSGLPTAVAGAGGLAIDPTTPSTLYSWGSGGALFRSTDGAASWNIVNSVTGVSWLVVDPKNSSTIYAGTSRGVVKSTNRGASWAFVNIAPDTYLFARLVLDPQDSNTLYAKVGGGIIKSTDGGASWSTLPGSQGLPATSLTIDPVTPSTLYAVAPFGGIFKSTDGGESWISIKAGQGEFFGALAVDPVTPSTIYAGAFAVPEWIIYKSTDEGQNWRAVRAGIPADASVTSLAIDDISLAIDPGSPSRIYATYGNSSAGWGVIKSTDAGESWTVMNAGLPSGNFIAGSSVAIDPSNPATLYVGHRDRSGTGVGGIFKSTDGAASWNPANKGRSFVDTRVLAVDPVNAGTIYTAVGTDGVFKSVDRGANWTKLAAFQLPPVFGFSGRVYINSLVIDFLRPNTLYALTARTEGGITSTDRFLFKSTDGGVTWSDSVSPISSAFSPAALVMDPTDSNRLYLGISYLEAGEEGYALLKSTDGGASWSNLGCCMGKALMIDPTNPATLYGGAPSGLLKSTDGGASWSNTGLSIGVNVLALDPANTSVIYAATGAGLFKSADGGVNWAPINDGLASLIATRSAVTALVINPVNPQTLYAGTSGYGVFRSSDGGAHWTPFNDGLPNLDIRLLALTPGGANALYVGTVSGIFVINLASETIPFTGPQRR
jgi:photosystem II stability/assembly factor-like uncharacterized protein